MNRAIMSPKVAPPTSHFSHAIEVPAGSRIVFVTGQIPLRTDGTVPQGITEQCELVWQNIFNILAEAGMGVADIVKIQGFVVRPADMRAYRMVREHMLAGHRPASTMICVPALGRPEWLVEIEAVAAKPEPTEGRARKTATQRKALAKGRASSRHRTLARPKGPSHRKSRR